ncbi:MAG: hypothetical protein AB8G77_26360 [Rhodothermales bacterium]
MRGVVVGGAFIEAFSQGLRPVPFWSLLCITSLGTDLRGGDKRVPLFGGRPFVCFLGAQKARTLL